MTRRTFLGALAAALEGARPNLLFSLGSLSPGVEASLSRSGIRFTHCFTSDPECPAARNAIITGLAQSAAPPSKDLPAWPAVMRRAGYRTLFRGSWRGAGKPADLGFEVLVPDAHALPESPYFLWAEEDRGRSVAALDSSGGQAGTIVFATRLNCSQAASLRDADVRVPLLVRVPGLGKAGSSSANLCYLHDLLPTACELLGLPPVKTGGGSLKRRVRDQVFCSYRDTLRMVQTERWKLIRNRKTGSVELYDTAADPAESRNLSGDPAHRGTLAEMERRLAAALAGTARRAP
jgi:arylsulfatase A-like enzyme